MVYVVSSSIPYLRAERERVTEKERERCLSEAAMVDLFAWLGSFFLVIGIIGAVLFQLMCLADLEFDYINPYDTASRVNKAVLPEFIAEGVLCLLLLITGHWGMCLLGLPYAYYNVTIYTRRQHLLDVTEIFNQLHWEKKVRFIKISYLIIFLALTIFWMIWSVVDE